MVLKQQYAKKVNGFLYTTSKYGTKQGLIWGFLEEKPVLRIEKIQAGQKLPAAWMGVVCF